MAAVNRRLDEWVTKERLNFDEVTKPEPASKNEEVGAMPGSVCAIGHSTQRRLCVIVVFVFGQRGKKRRKRKDPEDDKDHQERAHEEATKIKNVQRIQFGKYMIDTWYYSPFPQVSFTVRGHCRHASELNGVTTGIPWVSHAV